MKRLSQSIFFASLFLSARIGTALGAADPPKLPGTAAPFAGVPWGSSPETIEAILARHGYQFVQRSGAVLVFTGTSDGRTAHVFELLDGSEGSIKAVLEIPLSQNDPIALFRSLRASMIETYGKPSEDAERGADRADLANGSGVLATFWLYRDGSSIILEVSKELSVEVNYFAPPSSKIRAGAAKPIENASLPAFTGPTGWSHVGTSDGLGTWSRPGGDGFTQTITVLAKNGIESLDALVRAESTYAAHLPDVAASAPTDVTVCGKYPAKYLSYTYSSPSGIPVTTEDVVTVIGSTGYSARYDKSISQYADPEAERALLKVCGRKN